MNESLYSIRNSRIGVVLYIAVIYKVITTLNKRSLCYPFNENLKTKPTKAIGFVIVIMMRDLVIQ